MAWAAAIPAAMSLVSSLTKSGQQQPQQQAQPQGLAPMQSILPDNPFPQNFPDGGKKQPSIFDTQPMQMQQQPQQDDYSNPMVPGGGKPLSVVDAFLPGGSSPSIFNPVQDPLQSALGGLLKGIFK